MSSTTTSTEDKAITLLGQGIGAEAVAAAIGVTTSRISQLLSDPIFSSKVAELRFQNLSKHNERDNRYDTMEDKLLEKMEDLLPMMMRPMEVLKAISVINMAKRRGSSTPESITQKQTVIPLVLPQILIQNFSAETNINNQVVKIGNQDLVTIQSARMNQLLSKSEVPYVEATNAERITSSGASIAKPAG